MHQRTKWGADGHKHAHKIYEIMETHGLLTVLDYGCGRGTLKEKMREIADVITVTEYDPAIPGKDKLPAPAALVVCTDVLEHVEIGMIGTVLNHLNELAGKAVYLVISCRAANAVLPNGKNAHLIIKPPDWWLVKVKDHFTGEIKAYGNEKELIVEILK